MQLVTEHVSILNPTKDNLVVDPAGVEAILGVPPERMVSPLASGGSRSGASWTSGSAASDRPDRTTTVPPGRFAPSIRCSSADAFAANRIKPKRAQAGANAPTSIAPPGHRLRPARQGRWVRDNGRDMRSTGPVLRSCRAGVQKKRSRNGTAAAAQGA